jgi:hypothetical protein
MGFCCFVPNLEARCMHPTIFGEKWVGVMEAVQMGTTGRFLN